MSPQLWGLERLERWCPCSRGGSYPSTCQPLPDPGPAASHAHPGQAARQGAGQVPTVHSEAKRWAPSSWQRERQLAQEGRSQGADCWGRVPKIGCPPELFAWSWEESPSSSCTGPAIGVTAPGD